MSLAALGDQAASTVIAAIQQEYPNSPRHMMRHDADQVTPQGAHPAFYGCFDWHSAVEMHWALIELLRAAPAAHWGAEARAVLDRHLTSITIDAEVAYLVENPGWERPYGWGWALQLAASLDAWDDPDAQRWSAAVRPLAGHLSDALIQWLPKPAYPDRTGMHSNSAFALTRSLPWATKHRPDLLAAIRSAAGRWYGSDTAMPATYEPSGSDFLSPFLTEAVLMAQLLDPEAWEAWWSSYAPVGLPPNLAVPAVVTDPEDGQGAHLHGLNLYRVHAFRALASVVPESQRAVLERATASHAEAGREALADTGWMSEHWLTAYGLLAFG